MAIKYAMHSEDYETLKSILPERGLPHKDLYFAQLYYDLKYNNIQLYLKKLGLSILIKFGYASRKDNFIEFDHGKGATISYQFYPSSDSTKGSLTKISDKNNAKQSDVDVNDPELKYRKSNAQSQRDSPVVKTRYNPFSKKDEIIKDTTTVTKDDYNKWQCDDDLPF